MDTNYKKVLIICHDSDFAESALELLKKSEVEITLAVDLLEGENILKKETFSLVVIECPVVMGTETLSNFISQTNLTKTRVFLVAKEKRFLAGLDSLGNVSVFDQSEIYTQVSGFIKNTNF